MSGNGKTVALDKIRFLPFEIELIQQDILHPVAFKTDEMMVMAAFREFKVLPTVAHDHTMDNPCSL